MIPEPTPRERRSIRTAIVVIPTYNERETLGELVETLLALPLDVALSVLIVDDNSPDGTGDVADALAAHDPDHVHVLHRQTKAGLGRAYIAGFDAALRSQPDCVVEMDADGSHDPRELAHLLRAADDADLIVGSRYTAGGGITNWNLPRRLISRYGNWYARTVLGVRLADLTTGYKCFRREVLEHIAYARAQSIGYNFQIELTYRAIKDGFTVREVPIQFAERQVGKSKFRMGIILESFFRVLALRMEYAGRGTRTRGR